MYLTLVESEGLEQLDRLEAPEAVRHRGKVRKLQSYLHMFEVRSIVLWRNPPHSVSEKVLISVSRVCIRKDAYNL